MYKLVLIIWMIVTTFISYSQNEHHLVRKGNKLYSKDQFGDAEAKYKKALEVDQKHYEGSFNLGDSYFEQGRFDEAITQFTIAAHSTDDDIYKNKAYYNLGNANLEAFKSINQSADQEDMQKKMQYLDNSIEAYKNALKINPQDQESKYNLSYALKHKPEGGQQSKQQNKDQENKDQEEKEKEKEEEKKQNQDQQKNKDKQEKENKQQAQPKPDEQKMDKQEAEKIMKKQEEKEKDVQKKVLQKKEKPVKVKIEKEW